MHFLGIGYNLSLQAVYTSYGHPDSVRVCVCVCVCARATLFLSLSLSLQLAYSKKKRICHCLTPCLVLSVQDAVCGVFH